ncbi:MAG: sugar phosphate nucleotidyltransferase [Limisphaerales bacterium]
MSRTSRQIHKTSKVLCVIMGGGQGTRLFPLTKDRAKPAVPLAGKYRLVDIPISNCINSGFRRIYILTQFNSTSLHGHISRTYKFDQFTNGFVEILAAQQTLTNTSWYEGTADAVRKNLVHFLNHDFDYLIILSGDQLYRMDFRPLIAQHIETEACITVATIPVGRKEATSLGLMQIADDNRITRFAEKPKEDSMLDSMRLTPNMLSKLEIKGEGDAFLASMGIYVFSRDLITGLLDNPLSDFGKHIIPNAINNHAVYSYVFQGYWEDIGTIRSFFEANLDLVSELAAFQFL